MLARSTAWQATKTYPAALRPKPNASVGAHLNYPFEVPDGYRSPAARAKDGGPMVRSPGRSPTSSPDTTIKYPRAPSPLTISGCVCLCFFFFICESVLMHSCVCMDVCVWMRGCGGCIDICVHMYSRKYIHTHNTNTNFLPTIRARGRESPLGDRGMGGISPVSGADWSSPRDGIVEYLEPKLDSGIPFQRLMVHCD